MSADTLTDEDWAYLRRAVRTGCPHPRCDTHTHFSEHRDRMTGAYDEEGPCPRDGIPADSRRTS